MKLLVSVADSKGQDVLQALRLLLGSETVTVIDDQTVVTGKDIPEKKETRNENNPELFNCNEKLKMVDRTRMQVILKRYLLKYGEEVNGCTLHYWKTITTPQTQEARDYYIGIMNDPVKYNRTTQGYYHNTYHPFKGVFLTYYYKEDDRTVKFYPSCLPYSVKDKLHGLFVEFVNKIIAENPDLCGPNNDDFPSSIGVLSSEFDKRDISRATANILQAADIESFGELLHYSTQELMKFRNFGPAKLEEVKRIVHNYGLKFRDEKTI